MQFVSIAVATKPILTASAAHAQIGLGARYGQAVRTWLMVALIPLSATVACSVDPSAPVIEGSGEFRGIWDWERWLGRGYAVLIGDTLTLIGHRPDPNYYYDEFVTIQLHLQGNGTYSLPAAGSARMMKIVGGDAGHFPEASGRISINGVSNFLSGSIELQANGPDGQLWRFERGRFAVPVYYSYSDTPSLRASRSQ